MEYEKKRADRISEGNFDFAKWYGLYFDVENGRITMIDFGDLRAVQCGHEVTFLYGGANHQAVLF